VLLRSRIPYRYNTQLAHVPHPRPESTLIQGQNNNYPNPPRAKRAHRDPHGGWWDAQEKRNFGEPVHEDNEILGVFSPEQYTHVSSGKGFFHLGCFVVAFLGLCGVVSLNYPDKASVPRTFPDGLEKELGGPNALPVCTWDIYLESPTENLTRNPN
jgi:hypothetical protein